MTVYLFSMLDVSGCFWHAIEGPSFVRLHVAAMVHEIQRVHEQERPKEQVEASFGGFHLLAVKQRQQPQSLKRLFVSGKTLRSHTHRGALTLIHRQAAAVWLFLIFVDSQQLGRLPVPLHRHRHHSHHCFYKWVAWREAAKMFLISVSSLQSK